MLLGHEKVSFLHLPTPLEYLPGVSKDLGVEFYIKRDDLTNLGVGGNKLRKLEYLLKDAQDQGCTMLLTLGGAQTNHGRLTAAAVKARYEAQGEKVYEIPIGGSSDVGMLGYYECAMELTEQAKQMGLEDATVVSAVGSIGTYMGLYCGLKNENSPWT